MKTEERNLLIVGVAALFRAAGIAAGREGETPNIDALDNARIFVEACEHRNLLPKDDTLT